LDGRLTNIAMGALRLASTAVSRWPHRAAIASITSRVSLIHWQPWWCPRRGAASNASSAAALAAQSRELLTRANGGGSTGTWQCGARVGLTGEDLAREATHVQKEIARFGPDALAGQLGVQELCSLCRLLTASGHLPDGKLLTGAVSQLRKLLGSGSGPAGIWDAGAALALSICEAGEEHGLGAKIVSELCAVGAAAVVGDNALSGAGAAALALAAAAAGCADGPLFEALLGRCSRREVDLCPSTLGELRLAALLAGPNVIEQIDARAMSFLRTLCLEAPLDDPRIAILPIEAGAFDEALTPFEAELSEALTACEIPHSRAGLVSDLFLPLSALNAGGAGALGGMAARGQLAIFAEDVAARAVYSNMQTRRCAFQRWKYSAVVAAGWRIFPVAEGPWRALVGREARAAHLRDILQSGPLDPLG